MAEVIVSTPDLTVLGGPASVQVDTSFGASGPRGTFVMYGLLDPNNENATFIETPAIFDLYLLVDPSSPDYLQVYQYVIEDNQALWIPTVKLTPNFYGTNRVVTFAAGEAELKINVFELGLVNLRAEVLSLLNTKFLFSIQATLSNYEVASEINPLIPSTHLPAAVSVEVQDIELDPTDNELKIPITLHGAEFNGTAMQAISGKNVIAHLSILVINPNDVLDALIGDES
jgi:hypothetical protein